MTIQFLSETIVEIIQEGLAGHETSSTLGGDLGLRQVDVDLEELSLEIIPESLRELFVFREKWKADFIPFRARSISIAVMAMRIDDCGNLIHSSPSIRGASLGITSKFLPCGEWGKKAALSPDLYVEAEFYETEDGGIITVPTIYREPYNHKDVERPAVSVQLSTANLSVEDWQHKHTKARMQFTELMNWVSQELGVPAGEQFLVCFVGFPQYSKAFDRGDSPFWGAAFDGGYLVGGRKIGSSKSLSSGLSKLRVRSDLLIGGKPLKERIVAEMTRSFSKPKLSEPPKPKLSEPPKPKLSGSPKPKLSEPPKPKLSEPPKPKLSEPPPENQASILEKLNNLTFEEESEFTLDPVPIGTISNFNPFS